MEGGYHEVSRWPGPGPALLEEAARPQEPSDARGDRDVLPDRVGFQCSLGHPRRVVAVTTLLVAAVGIVALGRSRRFVPLDVDRHPDTVLKVSCGIQEKDVDYLTEESLFPIYGVETPSACMIHCTKNQGCAAWSWGRVHGNHGLVRACFLKGLAEGEVPVKQAMPGFVSGTLACPPTTTTSTTSSTTSATTTATFTATTSSSSITSTTSSSTLTYPIGSIFCFSLMLPNSYEQNLLAIQWREGAGIFACDEQAIYSNQDVEVAPGVRPSIVNSDLRCPIGGEFRTALNREIFSIVWTKVIQEGRYHFHDWTAKVDPDAVFFPNRLRNVLLNYTNDRELLEQDKGVYLNNCKFGMHGPLEVLSRNAVRAWGAGASRCLAHFHNLCSGPCLWGEDLFMDQCLWKVLNSTRVNETRLLTEDHCDPPKEWRSCKDVHSVAFHPFKASNEYSACLATGMAADQARMPTLSNAPRVFLSPLQRCSGLARDCSITRCCQQPGWECFRKNEFWAQCMPSCTPGIHMEESPEVRAPWECTRLAGS